MPPKKNVMKSIDVKSAVIDLLSKFTETSTEFELLQEHFELIEKLRTTLPIGPHCLLIYDLKKRKFIHCDDNIDYVLGVEKIDFLKGGVKMGWELLSFQTVYDMLTHIPKIRNYKLKNPGDVNELSLNISIPVQNKKTGGQTLLMQIVHFFQDDSGNNLAMGAFLSNITHISSSKRLQIAILSKKTGEVLYTVGPLTEFKNVLTLREEEVLSLIRDGYKLEEIAERLFISVNTVKNHKMNIFKKLNVKSSTQAINIFFN